MSARLGFSLETLREMDIAACDSDARLVWKAGDRSNIGIVQPSVPPEDWGRYFIQALYLSGSRELRLLGLQMIRHADNLERSPDVFEVVLP